MDIQKALDVLEKSIKELRFDYEQFFAGDSRIEPAKKRNEIKRVLFKLSNSYITNTGQKFRFLSLQGTFNSYQRLWDRILHEIEMGTYKPHIQKAEREKQFREEQRQKKIDWQKGLLAKADNEMRVLYDQYMEARRQTNAPGKVSFEGFKSSLAKQKPVLRKKFGGEIDFKISVENGRVKVKGVKKG